MKKHSISPASLVISLWENRNLILTLARRDAVGRYKGSFFGVLWTLLTPLMMLVVYTFVFSRIFKARWNTGNDSTTEFAIVLFAGLIVFNIFAECINRAPALILGHTMFVKKVVFPLEILPCVNLLSALFHAAISTCVLAMFRYMVSGTVPPTAALIPIALFPLVLFTLGISWWLAATGVYLRDIGQTIGVLVTALTFISPIFFPLSALPPRWQPIAKLNPLTFPIEQVRQVFVWGGGMDWGNWFIYTAAATLIAWFGFVWFQKTRKGFADVL